MQDLPSDPVPDLPDVPGWPGLRGQGALLPPPDADLDPLRSFLLPMPKRIAPPRWHGDMRAHIAALAPEFGGHPAIDLLLAAAIVDIRRSGGTGPGLALFNRLLEGGEGEGFATRLSLRWLRSVCDTLADHGASPEIRATAMTGSTLVTLSVAGESERKLFAPRRPWPPRAAFSRGGALFDGLVSFHPESGDMLVNFAARVKALAARDPVAGPFVAQILHRLQQADTALNRLAGLSGQPMPPVLKGPGRKALRWLIRKLL